VGSLDVSQPSGPSPVAGIAFSLKWFTLFWSEASTYVEDVCKKAPRRTFGPKREEVTGGWGKLLDKELHNLYSSDVIRRFRRMRCPVLFGDVRNAHILVGKLVERRPRGGSRRRWEGDIERS
jgi:hypothetical protein